MGKGSLWQQMISCNKRCEMCIPILLQSTVQADSLTHTTFHGKSFQYRFYTLKKMWILLWPQKELSTTDISSKTSN